MREEKDHDDRVCEARIPKVLPRAFQRVMGGELFIQRGIV